MLTTQQATRLGSAIADLWHRREECPERWMDANGAFVPLNIDEMIEAAMNEPEVRVTATSRYRAVDITATGGDLGFAVLMGQGCVLVYRRDQTEEAPTSSEDTSVVAVVTPGIPLATTLGNQINGYRRGDTLTLDTAYDTNWTVRMVDAPAVTPQACF